jgi:hypothetical protein
VDGTSGSSGTSGTTGTSGSSGTSGTTGTSGSSGTSGTSATNGTGGTSGTSGTSATSGTTGTSGTSGNSGTAGTSGSSGTTGTSGTSGTSGTTGTSGTSGTSGLLGSATSPLFISSNNITIQQASGSQSGFLSSTDWTTFNGKQNALTNPVTGTGTTNYLPKFTGTSTVGNSQIFDDGTNVGIGTIIPGSKFDVTNTIGTAYDASNTLVSGQTMRIANLSTSSSIASTLLFIATGGGGGNGLGSISGVNTATGSVALTFGTRDSGGSVTERARITSDGNLLIGNTSNAGFKLDVNGTGRFGGNVVLGTTALTGGGAAQWLTANGTAYGGGLISSVSGVIKAYYYYDNGANAAMVQAAAGVGVQLWANNTVALSIASTGAATFSSSVTAGAAITNAATLHVNNTSSADPTSLSSVPTSNIFGMSTSPGGMLAAGIGTTGGTHVWLQARNVGAAGVSYPISLQPLGGSVGIGTASPVTNLDLNSAISGAYTTSSSQAPLRVFNVTNAGGINSSVISFQCSTDNSASNPVARIGVVGESAGSNNGAMVMMTRDGSGVIERMRITSGGIVQVMSGNELRAYRSDNTRYGAFYTDNLAVHITSSTDPIRISSADRTEFYNSGTERMRITSGGNVGIGTTSDNGARLQVNGNANFNGFGINSAPISSTGTSQNFVQLRNTGGDFYIGQEGSVAGGFFTGSGAYANVFYGITEYNFIIGGVRRLRISTTGAATFSSLGTGTVYSNGGLLTNTDPSDFNLKKNITPINYGLTEILQLNAVTFDWKNDPINQGKQYGFIAQEVQKIMPDLVKQGEYLGLDSKAIFTILVKAIQEQQAQIQELKNKLS